MFGDQPSDTSSVLFQEYRVLFEDSGTNPGEKTLEDKFFEHEVEAWILFVRMIS